MNRSLQTLALTWLATLATIGAAARPTIDHMLFAAAVLLGTLLAQLREHVATRKRKSPIVASLIGVAAVWALAWVRGLPSLSSRMPPRLGQMVMIVAAATTTLAVVFHRVLAWWVARAMTRAALGELEDLDLD